LEIWDKPTNNVAELRAAIKAIEIVKQKGVKTMFQSIYCTLNYTLSRREAVGNQNRFGICEKRI